MTGVRARPLYVIPVMFLSAWVPSYPPAVTTRTVVPDAQVCAKVKDVFTFDCLPLFVALPIVIAMLRLHIGVSIQEWQVIHAATV